MKIVCSMDFEIFEPDLICSSSIRNTSSNSLSPIGFQLLFVCWKVIRSLKRKCHCDSSRQCSWQHTEKGIGEKYQSIMMDSMGLALGIHAIVSAMSESKYHVLFIVSLALGGLVGTALDLDTAFNRLVAHFSNGSNLARLYLSSCQPDRPLHNTRSTDRDFSGGWCTDS